MLRPHLCKPCAISHRRSVLRLVRPKTTLLARVHWRYICGLPTWFWRTPDVTVLEKFNHLHQSIKFTLNWSYTEVAWFKTINSSANYLYIKSQPMPQTTWSWCITLCAHRDTKEAFKSQAIGVYRNYSMLEDFDEFIEPVKMGYLSRGYPVSELNNIIYSVWQTSFWMFLLIKL